MYGLLDDRSLLSGLSPLAPARCTAFAAGLAERLLPLFAVYADTAEREERYSLSRKLLDAVWQQPTGFDFGGDVTRLQDSVPDDDEGGVLAPYAQNAALAVLAAADSVTAGPPAAVLAAINCYGAADFAAGLAEPSLDPNDPEYETRVAASPFVQSALRAINNDLQLVQSIQSLRSHRSEAHRVGEQWAATWPRTSDGD